MLHNKQTNKQTTTKISCPLAGLAQRPLNGNRGLKESTWTSVPEESVPNFYWHTSRCHCWLYYNAAHVFFLIVLFFITENKHVQVHIVIP
jgi:hypothetical protein